VEYLKKITGIREVLKRDHMKVVFFGRTSNGKSTVINAMLRDKILPSGIGHTTSCFLQVEGINFWGWIVVQIKIILLSGGEAAEEPYLMQEDSTERQNVQSVSQMAHALCKSKLTESSLVRIFWVSMSVEFLKVYVIYLSLL
jgi:mitofusin